MIQTESKGLPWYQGLTFEEERVWFEKQVLSCEKDIIRFACYLSGNLDRARDLYQETMLRAFKYRRSFDSRYPLQNWIYAILLNIYRHQYKKEKLLKTFLPWKTNDGEDEENILDYIEAKEDGPEEKAIKNQMMVDLEKSIQELPLKMREVILACDVMGHSYEETSEIIGCPLGTVRSRLHRARRQVKKTMEEIYGKGFLTTWR
ncbi:MAG TPA: RNA polymerase sigma factor [Atribacteraceae bacterium]|nr:RNA polymerase sigma factor [Atribacteraceae bacterium]